MSLDILAYGIPLVDAVFTVVGYLPGTYSEYEKAPESTYSGRVKEIAQKVLSDIHPLYESSCYKTLQYYIGELPESVNPKDIQSFVDARLKVTATTATEGISWLDPTTELIRVAGTPMDTKSAQGKFFINIAPNIAKNLGVDKAVIDAALPWIVAREIYHILQVDWVVIPAIMTIMSLSAAILSTAVLGLSVLPSVCFVAGVHVVTLKFLDRLADDEADHFANNHCTKEEREHAITWLEKVKEDPRIGNIRLTLQRDQHTQAA